jgi:arabinogalactan oligomer/maltooligosaccharide transport system substrate-binding protein
MGIRRFSLALLLALGVTSGRSAAADLVLWHAYRAEEKAALEKLVAQYNAQTKGPKVTTLAVPYDAFADKISAAVPRGKGPDIFIYAQDRLGGWIEAGNTVEPVDFYLDDALKKRFIPTTLEAMTYRGSVYGLPLNYKEITLIYNKKLVKTPPKTTGASGSPTRTRTSTTTRRSRTRSAGACSTPARSRCSTTPRT